MEIAIEMNQIEFLVSTIAGPVIASTYFLLKLYLKKKKSGW